MTGGPQVRLTFAGDSADLERAMDNVGQAAGEMEQTFSARSAGLAAAGAGAAAALSAAFTQSLEFEQAGALLDAQLGAGSPLAAAAGEAAGSLYAGAYGESITEVNDAVRSVAQNISGMSTASAADLEAVTGQVMSLAQVMQVDVGQATSAVGQMIRNGLARDATEALDLLTAGTQQGANRMNDLADVFAEYGETFQVAGLDGATAMGIMTQAMDAGAWSADLVADGIREFGILAQDTASTAGPAFTALGLDAGQMAADVAAGGDRSTAALDATLDALRAMPPGTDRAGLAVALFGTKAEEMGDSLFAVDPSAATERLGTFAGAAAAADAALGDTGAARVEQMTRSFQEWGMSIAGVDGPLGTLAAGAMSFGAETLAMAGSAGMAVVALRGLGIGTALATGAQWAWNAAMSANPIGLVVLAIAGLVAGVIWAYNNVGWFRDGVDAAFRFVQHGIGVAVDGIGSALAWFGRLPGMALDWFGGMARSAIGAAVGLLTWLNSLPGRVLGAIGSFGGLLAGAGRDLLGGLWGGIQAAAGWLRDRVFGFFGSILPGWVRNILGIRSPSRVFAEMGVELPAGMGVGMDDGMPGLIAQASAMGEATRAAAADAMSGPFGLDGLTARPVSARPGVDGFAGDAAAMPGGPFAPGAAAGVAWRFTGDTDSAVATLIMHLVRTGAIQLVGV